MDKLWPVCVLVLAVVVFVMMRGGGDRINSEEAKKLVRSGALLLDVRTSEEFVSGHIEGAKNIPVGELGTRLGELEKKDQPIVVYCRSGARSSRAAEVLKSAGYESVHDLGGMFRW